MLLETSIQWKTCKALHYRVNKLFLFLLFLTCQGHIKMTERLFLVLFRRFLFVCCNQMLHQSFCNCIFKNLKKQFIWCLFTSCSHLKLCLKMNKQMFLIEMKSSAHIWKVSLFIKIDYRNHLCVWMKRKRKKVRKGWFIAVNSEPLGDSKPCTK